MPRRSPHRSALFALSGLVASGCGSGLAAGSDSQGTESGESGDSESESGSTTEGEPNCDEFLPDDGDFGPTVDVSLRNARAETIWVVNARATDCFIEIPFEVRDAADATLVWKTIEEEFSCPQVLDPEGFCGWECGVVQPVFRIEPGASLQVAWRASAFAELELPAQCSGCQADCWFERPIDDGTYTLRAVAGTECGGDCCEPDETGTCSGPVEPGAGPGGETLEASATLDYPAQTAVELVFE